MSPLEGFLSVRADTYLIPRKHFLLIVVMTIRPNLCQRVWLLWSTLLFDTQCPHSLDGAFSWIYDPVICDPYWKVKLWECRLKITDEQGIRIGQLRTLATSCHGSSCSCNSTPLPYIRHLDTDNLSWGWVWSSILRHFLHFTFSALTVTQEEDWCIGQTHKTQVTQLTWVLNKQ